jgi:transcriptional regulator with XRE-family HTH domain
MISEEQQLRDFGRQLARIRKERGFTQQRLANELDMHITSIGLIETGQRWPRLSTLYRMADVLNISVVDFFEHTRK